MAESGCLLSPCAAQEYRSPGARAPTFGGCMQRCYDGALADE